jgi:hypothetical protein
MGQIVPLHNRKGQQVGWLEHEDLTNQVVLRKQGLDPAKHMLVQPPGWATDAAHLELLEKFAGPLPAVVELRTSTGQTWRTTLDHFKEHAAAIDRGHGPQLVLPQRWWRTDDSQQPELPMEGL